MSEDSNRLDRRDFVKGVGTLAVPALAGCSGSGPDGSDETSKTEITDTATDYNTPEKEDYGSNDTNNGATTEGETEEGTTNSTETDTKQNNKRVSDVHRINNILEQDNVDRERLDGGSDVSEFLEMAEDYQVVLVEDGEVVMTEDEDGNEEPVYAEIFEFPAPGESRYSDSTDEITAAWTVTGKLSAEMDLDEGRYVTVFTANLDGESHSLTNEFEVEIDDEDLKQNYIDKQTYHSPQ